LSLSRRAAGKGNGGESSVSSLSEQPRQSPRTLPSRSSRSSQMSEIKRMMAGIVAMQAEMYALHGKTTTSPSTSFLSRATSESRGVRANLTACVGRSWSVGHAPLGARVR